MFYTTTNETPKIVKKYLGDSEKFLRNFLKKNENFTCSKNVHVVKWSKALPQIQVERMP